MVGKLTCKLISCDLEDLFGHFCKALNVRERGDSGEGYISKCVSMHKSWNLYKINPNMQNQFECEICGYAAGSITVIKRHIKSIT